MHKKTEPKQETSSNLEREYLARLRAASVRNPKSKLALLARAVLATREKQSQNP